MDSALSILWKLGVLNHLHVNAFVFFCLQFADSFFNEGLDFAVKIVDSLGLQIVTVLCPKASTIVNTTLLLSCWAIIAMPSIVNIEPL